MRFPSLFSSGLTSRFGQLEKLYYNYIAHGVILTRAMNFYIKIDDRTRATSNHAALYLAGFWLTVPLVCTVIIFPLYQEAKYVNWLFGTISFVTALGLSIEIYHWVEKIRNFVNNNLVGKTLIAGVAAASGAFSLAYASTIINTFTKVASTALPYTLTLVAIPSALVLIILILTVISAVIGIQTLASAVLMSIFNAIEITAIFFRGKFRLAGSEALKRRVLINFMRLIGCTALAITIIKFSEPYESGLNWLARHFAYGYEMQKFDRCAREGEKIVRINDEEILFARDPSHFETRPCAIGK